MVSLMLPSVLKTQGSSNKHAVLAVLLFPPDTMQEFCVRKQTAADIEFMRKIYLFSGNIIDKLLHGLLLRQCQLQESVPDLLRSYRFICPAGNLFSYAIRRIFGITDGKIRQKCISSSKILCVYDWYSAQSVLSAGKHCSLNCGQCQSARCFANFSADKK